MQYFFFSFGVFLYKRYQVKLVPAQNVWKAYCFYNSLAKLFNILFLSVGTDAPYCKGPPQQQVVVTRNSTVVLACEVEAEPEEVTFSWTFDPAKNYARPTSAYSSNMQIYAPNYDSSEKQLRNIHKLISPTYRNDPENSRRSLLTITPENNVQGVVCYAKNQVGRMQVPCAFAIQFVGKTKFSYFKM